MTAPWRQDPPQGYTVTHFDRGRGGHNPLHSMAGPEFTGVGAVYAPLGVLPPVVRLGVLVALLLVAMAGCTAAWVDYKHYTPSPSICRSVNSGVPAERPGMCVPASVAGVPR
ncbi:hypothetical protein [Nocardia suismassiliense]|uniref:hypothetical protein n=1 Tax=Nocardia suismassiliense TaxID=2077092 RepID=UPI000D1E101F|nr:hypothetical protein [Nocardia suismassiliense]